MANRLGGETSPYLLQHQDNPVHWQSWGDRALADARAEGKPILLSIGYAACHWCHVMAHESFEDPAIANLMNQLFVNIKVDREERPDIDGVYMTALGLMGEQGGWPLTMFLTPDGEPFWGGTYFPPEARYGRPGFPDILRRVAEVYHTDPAAVRKNADAILESLRKQPTVDDGAGDGAGEGGPVRIGFDILDRVAQLLCQQVDMVHGGLGQAPKFPQTYALEMLLRAWLRKPDGALLGAVDRSLTGMSQGGIYDHLAGGFARYSTDAEWLAPHFEKMLYDNAQLMDILTLAWQAGGNPLYAQRVGETVAWILNEMVVTGGGFAATLDADSEGEEGRFYVWNEAEIVTVLGDDAGLFKAAYDVSSHGNWEGKVILNRTARPELGDGAHEANLRSCRDRLLKQRDTRIRPGWDDKVLADWSGLMIAAMVNSGAVFQKPDWTAAAVAAFDFVIANLCPANSETTGELMHAFRLDQPKHRAVLDDYANMIRAALMLHETLGGEQYLQYAKTWTAAVEAHFSDPDHGGYFFSSDQATDVIARMRHGHDNAVPSGNGVMVGNLTRLWLLTGEDDYRQMADRVAAAFSSQLNSHGLAMTTLLNNVEFLLNPLQIVIIGARDDSATQNMLSAVHGKPLPNKVLAVLPADEHLPDSHPAAAMGQIDGRVTAYVCLGQTCSLPQTTAAGLDEALTIATEPNAMG
ncbi:MAG: thioredoxin domain-containing protein [Alphaproteobacteria bacterium]|jgi:hypothetical protein